MKIIKTYSPSFVWALNAIISLFLMPRKFQSFTTNQNIDCFVIVKNFRSNFMSSHPGQHTAAQRLQELCFPERNLRYKSLNLPATSTTLYSIYSGYDLWFITKGRKQITILHAWYEWINYNILFWHYLLKFTQLIKI